MKILVISNYYPPARPWGYTQWCYEVSKRLEERGHEVHILTSRYDADVIPPEEGIYRELFLENDPYYYSPQRFFLSWKKEEEANRLAVQNLCHRLKPDIIFVWGMYGLSRTVPAVAEQLCPDQVAYYMSDHWPTLPTLHESFWSRQAKRKSYRAVRQVLVYLARKRLEASGHPPQLQLKNAMIVSHAVRRNMIRAGIPLESSVVVHGGSDTAKFLRRRDYSDCTNGGPLRLLFAGCLVEHKGPHTAIEAMALLGNKLGKKLRLDIVGDGHPEYERRLRELVSRHRLEAEVSFCGRADAGKMPEVFAHHDVLLFPSIYEEPLARTLQEAMLSGLVVVSTLTGGSGEMLVDSETGLAFEKDNPADLASKIEILNNQRSLIPILAERGQENTLAHFTLDRMVNQIEARLFDVLKRDSREQCAFSS